MRDERKLKLAVIVVSLLCLLAVVYNAASESFLPGIEGYVKRRIYYERVISRKGLSMHEARYWRQEGPGGER